MALTVSVLPGLSYIAIHWAVLGHWVHLWALLLLVSGPAAVLAVLPGGLWWLPGPPAVVKGAHGCCCLRRRSACWRVRGRGGFEGRVVFYAFTPYIKMTPPWSYVAVTAALLGLALLGVAHLTGILGTSLDVTLAGSCLMLCTTAGAVAAGVPVEWLPAPLVAAVGLSLYYDSRSVREYGIFVAGALMTAAWFVSHHFWFLDARVGHLRVRTACRLALAALAPALAIPGLVIAQSGRAAVGVLLFVQAELVCILEEQLYSAAALEGPGAEPMYPAYLVVITSAAGALAASRLAAARLAPRWAGWVVPALYAAKLCMLVVPEAHLVLPVGLLALAAAAPAALHEPPQGKRRCRIKPWQGLAHAGAIVSAALLARFAVFDVVQWAAMGRPHEGVLLGALLVATALALAPLVSRCYRHNQAVFRLNAGLGLLGVMLMLLQPPVPRAGGSACPQLPFALCPRLWDARHVPMHEADDAAVWASGLGRREHWSRWLLVAAAALGLAGASGAAPGGGAAGARLVMGGGAGALVGHYLALEAVPGQEVLQMLVLGTTIAVVVFITLLQNPMLGSPAWLPLLGIGWAGAAALTLLLQGALPLPDTERFKRLYPDSAIGIEAERRAAARALLVGVFSAQAMLMAFSLKLRAAAALRGPEGAAPGARANGAGASRSDAYGAQPDYFCGVVPAAALGSLGARANLPGAAGAGLRRLAREGLGWVPTFGNACTLLAFAGGLAVNSHVTRGEPEPVLLLAPLLLLLGRDALLLRGLGEQQRYFPPVLAVSLYLTALSVANTVGWGLRLADARFWALEIGLLLITLPTHVLFLQHAWAQRPQPLAALAALAPLSGLALFLTELEAVQYLAAVALAMAVLMFLNVRQLRRRGMKAI
ncbi:MAG: hypothetical protein J3K34DRAFT_462917 [Monoraphidium minutum]|nr:MAG: hypothetical protein J3K34DRAFT_462917 [Monoraphidium minutum]